MTDIDESYDLYRPTTSPEAKIIAKRFSTAINDFRWRSDYLKFCKVLGYEPTEYTKKEYNKFLQLAESLHYFDPKSLAKLIDAGEGKQ
ncbi:hypothetical protein [Cylindrospermum sp. FACHB-282]|uniref:hypothetical protein n=1 Tax=Cylindrospermum sp. FACHB-282 TaxID=2692794 RepID=UPI001682CDDB|nr:hypothetical protein [Cylindrospermum sp. FACHB-282]MBD2387849.1 hypothetical protein [Cylindrospermum sp. FACHB-282]